MTIDPVVGSPFPPILDVDAFIPPSTVRLKIQPSYTYPPIIEYKIKYSKYVDFTPASSVQGFITRTKNITGLDINTRWYFRVGERNSLGWGGWSNSVNYLTPNVPAKMAAPLLEPIAEPTNVNVTIVAPADGGAPILKFTIQWWPANEYVNAKSKDITYAEYLINPTITINDILPGILMYFRVRAVNSQGDGPQSDNSTITLTSGSNVKDSNEHKLAVCYIKTVGVWKIAIPYVKTSGVWSMIDG